MKKTLIAFSVAVMLAISIFLVIGISGCEWFDTSVLNKPKKTDIEALEQKEKEAEEQRKLEEAQARFALEQVEKEEKEKQEVMKPYHVVLGCFEIKENAEKMITLLKSKGYSPYEFKFGSYTCVSVKSYDTLHEAEKALEYFLTQDYCPEDPWVHKITN